MWISLFLALIGLIFGLRTIHFLHQRCLLSQFSSCWAAVMMTLLQLGLFFLSTHVLHAWALCLLVPFLLPLLSFAIFQWKIRKFHSAIPLFLDQLVLHLGSGKSLRCSLELLQEQLPPGARFFIEDCLIAMRVGHFSSRLQHDPTVLFLGQLILQVDQTKFRTLDRVKAVRNYFKLQKKLRLRCEAGLSQARAQSWVVLGFFLIAVLWNLASGHIQWKSFVLSSALMVFGHVCLSRMGKRFLWNN